MQVNYSIVIVLATTCCLGVITGPTIDVSQYKPSNLLIRPGWLDKLKLCGMGLTCKETTDCCTPFKCFYATGYTGSSKRCCGGPGATGCTVVEGGDGKGCCYNNYCAWDGSDPEKKTTVCKAIIHKKKRAVRS